MAIEVGQPRHHFRTIGSTNAEARRLALDGAPSGTVVTSEEQTEGRGRQGRPWATPAGKAIAYSAVIRQPIEIPGLFPLRAGLAACEAIESLGGEGAEVKWPNDVLLGGRKCAGVLVEARPQDGWAVVGIGINLTIEEDEFPEEFRHRATSVGGAVTIDQAAEALNRSLAHWLTADPAEVVSAIAARDALAGRGISWSEGSGRASGVAADGRLVVLLDDGSEVLLDAGEVHLDAA